MKKVKLCIGILLISLLVLSVVVHAEESSSDSFIDADIPDSWFEAPKNASEMGITKFNQSPILDAKVENGELPPVEDRLPEDPPTVEPYDQVGKYGGTGELWGTSLGWTPSNLFCFTPVFESAGRVIPDGSKVVPYYLKDWEFTDNAETITLYLREGMKWSDGQPVTSADYMFWWDYIAYDSNLTPVPPEKGKPVGIIDMQAPDKYTVIIKFDKPYPRTPDFDFTRGMGPGGSTIVPSHYLKQIHPEFVDKSKIEKLAKSVGQDHWYEYFDRVWGNIDNPNDEHMPPTMRPYIPVERTTNLLEFERNPYYPFVDTEGNQLPYIDKIKINLANSSEMAALKMATGEATLGARYTVAQNLPLYRKNEEKENYTTYLYSNVYGSDVTIFFNLSHKEPELSEIFSNTKFRRAMSLAIDRETINEKLYFGLALPMQASVPPTNKYYKEEYAESYAEYAPEEAKKLLDEIGMIDKDEDGFRERPDGEEFNPTLLYRDYNNPTAALELIKKSWEEIGIDVNLKLVEGSLWTQQADSNEFDITFWILDGVLDVSFGNPWHIQKAFAPNIGFARFGPWPGYVNWYKTDGEEGIEPPQEIKELIKLSEDLAVAPDKDIREKAGRELVKAQAENLWAVGTVAFPPKPIMASNKLKNIPKKGLWDYEMSYMASYYPIQFYLEE